MTCPNLISTPTTDPLSGPPVHGLALAAGVHVPDDRLLRFPPGRTHPRLALVFAPRYALLRRCRFTVAAGPTTARVLARLPFGLEQESSTTGPYHAPDAKSGPFRLRESLLRLKKVRFPGATEQESGPFVWQTPPGGRPGLATMYPFARGTTTLVPELRTRVRRTALQRFTSVYFSAAT